jgi:hypothetical protein
LWGDVGAVPVGGEVGFAKIGQWVGEGHENGG